MNVLMECIVSWSHCWQIDNPFFPIKAFIFVNFNIYIYIYMYVYARVWLSLSVV